MNSEPIGFQKILDKTPCRGGRRDLLPRKCVVGCSATPEGNPHAPSLTALGFDWKQEFQTVLQILVALQFPDSTYCVDRSFAKHEAQQFIFVSEIVRNDLGAISGRGRDAPDGDGIWSVLCNDFRR